VGRGRTLDRKRKWGKQEGHAEGKAEEEVEISFTLTEGGRGRPNCKVQKKEGAIQGPFGLEKERPKRKMSYLF